MATDAKENPDEKIMWHDRSLTDLQIKFPVMLKWLSASSYFLERFLSTYYQIVWCTVRNVNHCLISSVAFK